MVWRFGEMGPKTRITLHLDEALLSDLMRVTGSKTRTEAIKEAVQEYVRRQKIDRLRGLSGKVSLFEDWREREQEGLIQQDERERRLRGDP